MLLYDDLLKICDLLNENGYDQDSMEVYIPLLTKELLNKVNEDIYYKTHPEDEIHTNVDEINVCVGNKFFKYYVDNRQEDNDQNN